MQCSSDVTLTAANCMCHGIMYMSAVPQWKTISRRFLLMVPFHSFILFNDAVAVAQVMLPISTVIQQYSCG